METADILTKFIISTQRQAETEIYRIGLYDIEENAILKTIRSDTIKCVKSIKIIFKYI